MRNSHAACSVINLLRQPFTQRLITLAVSTLLAVSLTCMPIALASHTSEHQTAFHSSQVVFVPQLAPERPGIGPSYELSPGGRRGA